MRKKQPSFFLMKFNSDRLKNANYKIKLDFSTGQKNGEIVRLSDNQVLRTLRKLKNKEFNQDELNELIRQRKILNREIDSEENRIKIDEINKKIEDILFVPEIISVKFQNKSHYKNIKSKGLFINGNKYVRFLAGAGNLRRNTVFYIQQDYLEPMNNVLNNGRDETKPVVPAKFSAYFGLYNSSSTMVDFPDFAVIPDCTRKKICKVDWVSGSGTGTTVEEKDVEMTFNLFDGQGLISPELMSKWATNIGLDYIPSWAIIRAPFIKGNVVTFDFHDFARTVAQKNKIIDVWGNEVNLDKIELLLSESQFKMWDSYKNIEIFAENCKKNELFFGISRYAPSEEKEKNYVYSNYQFTQVLDLDQKSIESLCKPTIDYIKDLSGMDANKMILYLMGDGINYVGEDDWFNEIIQDDVVKALLLNKEVSKDVYVRQRFIRSLNKTIRESMLGSTLHQGNFSAMICDPYAQAQHAFGMEVKGILNPGEYYSNFWNRKGVNKVSACRAPLTHHSEVNILNLKQNTRLNYWYQYIKTGTIFPSLGQDVLSFADSDYDGDLVFSTSQPEFIYGAKGGRPVSYAKRTASKVIPSREDIANSDLASMNSKVGFVTNVSSTYHALLCNYATDTPQYKEIQMRLAALRREQGNTIDAGKGIIVDPFPQHWVKFQKVDNNMSDEEKKLIAFENKLLADKRPLFFINLYPHYKKQHLKELRRYTSYCEKQFGKRFLDIVNSDNRTDEEQDIVDKYYKYSFFIHNNCTMNNLMRYMQSQVKEVKEDGKKSKFNYSVFIDKNIPINNEKLEKMSKIHRQYFIQKAAMNKNMLVIDDEEISNIEQYASYLRKVAQREISSNINELANLAVLTVYKEKPTANKEFAWKLFGGAIIENLKENSGYVIEVPIRNELGDIEYLWRKHSLVRYVVE